MANETVSQGLRQEIIFQQSRLFKAVCGLITLAGAGLYLEGLASNGPTDSLAGAAAVAITAIVYLRRTSENPRQQK